MVAGGVAGANLMPQRNGPEHQAYQEGLGQTEEAEETFLTTKCTKDTKRNVAAKLGARSSNGHPASSRLRRGKRGTKRRSEVAGRGYIWRINGPLDRLGASGFVPVDYAGTSRYAQQQVGRGRTAM